MSQLDQWDSSLRGPKMSSNTGKVIFKYLMPVSEVFQMTLPKNAHIIRLANEKGHLWMWAVVDTTVEDEVRNFRAFKCGGSGMEGEFDLVYVGHVAIYIQAELMLYIFEDVTE